MRGLIFSEKFGGSLESAASRQWQHATRTRTFSRLSRKAKTIPTLTPGLFSVSSLFDKNRGAAANNKSHSKKNPLDQQDDSESEAANRLQINRRLLHNKIEEHWIKE